jgi:hypothetical protein
LALVALPPSAYISLIEVSADDLAPRGLMPRFADDLLLDIDDNRTCAFAHVHLNTY